MAEESQVDRIIRLLNLQGKVKSGSDVLDDDKPRPKLSLKSLADNFETVFPRSIPIARNEITELKEPNLKDRFVLFRFQVRSINRNVQYRVSMRVLRNKPGERLRTNLPVEVKCDCPAFNFWLAHVLWKHGSHLGKPKSRIKPPPNIRNPRQVPTFCKHVFGVVRELIRSGVIKVS